MSFLTFEIWRTVHPRFRLLVFSISTWWESVFQFNACRWYSFWTLICHTPIAMVSFPKDSVLNASSLTRSINSMNVEAVRCSILSLNFRSADLFCADNAIDPTSTSIAHWSAALELFSVWSLIHSVLQNSKDLFSR
jgi:hypothetical protein